MFINSKYADVDRSRSNVNCSGVTHIVSISSLLCLVSDVVDSSALFFLSHFRISIAECLIVVAEEVPCHCRARHRHTIYMGARILHAVPAGAQFTRTCPNNVTTCIEHKKIY